MPRVLHVFSSGNLTGGAAFSMTTLAEGLHAKDDVEVVAMVPKTKSKDVATRLRAAGITTHEVHISWTTHHPYGSGIRALAMDAGTKAARRLFTASTNRKIAQVIMSEGIDLVHLCDGIVNMGLAPALRLGKPLVWHLREFVDLDHGDEYDDRRQALDDLSKATAAIAISNTVAGHFARLVPSLPISTVYNGIVPAAHFCANADGSGHDVRGQRKNVRGASGQHKAKLLFLGGINRAKGTFEILEGMAELKDSIGSCFELDVFGRPRGTTVEEFERTVRSLRLDDCVSYRGWANMGLDTIASYDLELTCSRFEAFGRITAEAMCARTAVVGANTAGTAELLANGRGFLYDQGDPQSLALVTEQALRDADLRGRTVDTAYAFARDNFTVERYVDGVLEVYSRALGTFGA